MRFMVEPAFAQQILGGQALSVEDARTIARLAYLTAELDFEEDDDELDTLDGLSRSLFSLAGRPQEPVLVSPLPIDDEERVGWIHELAEGLSSERSRELAYVVAYLLAASDFELAPIESQFLDDLQHMLGIDDDRAADLVAMAAEQVTPGTYEDLAPRYSSRI